MAFIQIPIAGLLLVAGLFMFYKFFSSKWKQDKVVTTRVQIEQDELQKKIERERTEARARRVRFADDTTPGSSSTQIVMLGEEDINSEDNSEDDIEACKPSVDRDREEEEQVEEEDIGVVFTKQATNALDMSC